MEIKIIVVDDEEIVCNGLSRLLKKRGYPVVDCVTDGERALNAIKEKKYDIILLDINMPKKSGIELLPEIKEISADSQVIIVTAYDDVEMKDGAMKAGACDYFVKSSNYKELLIKINNCIKYRNLDALNNKCTKH